MGLSAHARRDVPHAAAPRAVGPHFAPHRHAARPAVHQWSAWCAGCAQTAAARRCAQRVRAALVDGNRGWHFARPPNAREDGDYSTQPWPLLADFFNANFAADDGPPPLLHTTLLGWLHDPTFKPAPLPRGLAHRFETDLRINGQRVARQKFLRGVACAAQDGFPAEEAQRLRERFRRSRLRFAWTARHPEDEALDDDALYGKIIARLHADYEKPRVLCLEALRTRRPLTVADTAGADASVAPADGALVVAPLPPPLRSASQGLSTRQKADLIEQLRAHARAYVATLEVDQLTGSADIDASEPRWRRAAQGVLDGFLAYL